MTVLFPCPIRIITHLSWPGCPAYEVEVGGLVNLPRGQTEGRYTGKEVGRVALPTCPKFLEPCVQDLLMTYICPTSGSLPPHPVISGLALLFLSLVIYLKCEEVSRKPSRTLSCHHVWGQVSG